MKTWIRDGRLGGGGEANNEWMRIAILWQTATEQERRRAHYTGNQHSVKKEFATFAGKMSFVPSLSRLHRHVSKFSREMLSCKSSLFTNPCTSLSHRRSVQLTTCYNHLLTAFWTVISTALISRSKILARFQGITVVWLNIQACRDVYAVSTGKQLPTFQRNVVPSSSKRR
jgi:hypothetical protein